MVLELWDGGGDRSQLPKCVQLVNLTQYNFVPSGVCLGQCLREADSPTDRWSTVSCSICCLMDLDGDNALTLEEMIEAQIMFCGSDEQGKYASVIQELTASFSSALCYCTAELLTWRGRPSSIVCPFSAHRLLTVVVRL